MRTRILLLLCLSFVLPAQFPHQEQPPPPPSPEETRLPNGKLQRDEILKAEYEKSLQDSRELAKLAGELKTDLEKNRFSRHLRGAVRDGLNSNPVLR